MFQGKDNKPMFVCSIIVVIVQLSKMCSPQVFKVCSLLKILKSRLLHVLHAIQEFSSVALRNLLPWAMTQQFSVRTFAQGALLTIWRRLASDQLCDIMRQNQLLESFDDFVKKNQ